ncbi:MAG: hypothetical protein JW772_01645, partial [Candidatus Diapherotrites archaeon]|nr:hypothetical protein [Candidatus Diapherotrites archaeon]
NGVFVSTPVISGNSNAILFRGIENFLEGEEGSNIFLVRPDGTDFSQLTKTREPKIEGDKKITYPKSLPAVNSSGTEFIYLIFPHEHREGSTTGKTGSCYLEYAEIQRKS